jgi:type IV pilus assembly protein PilB
VPLIAQGNKLLVAMANPLDIFAIDEMRMATGYEIEPLIAVQDDVQAVIDGLYKEESQVNDQVTSMMTAFDDNVELGGPKEEELSEAQLAALGEDGPIIRLANLIVSQAVRDKASDIHMEPKKEEMIVRYRVDGVLQEIMRLPKKVVAPLTSRFKIMSNMDIAEKRVPQDNRISATIDGRDFDFRVSTLPVVYGEKIVMRVLDKGGINVGLEKLGFLPNNLALLSDMAERSYGILLVTGPTGSGKSTTLYSLINKINDGTTNIITIEDPVEYELSGINQCAVNNRAGMTFAAGLKAMLRQDPDIIMVGEMRDTETATIAMEAALTGHFVLSTLHTNDAPGACTRLIDMEVEPFLISSSLIGVLAQRLVRGICPSCKSEFRESKDTLIRYGFPIPQEILDNDGDLVIYKGTGCDKCKNSGYKGRTGVHELMSMTDDVRDEILKRSPSHTLRKLAEGHGMKSLQDDAVAKILNGTTTIDEVLRVIYA